MKHDKKMLAPHRDEHKDKRLIQDDSNKSLCWRQGDNCQKLEDIIERIVAEVIANSCVLRQSSPLKSQGGTHV